MAFGQVAKTIHDKASTGSTGTDGEKRFDSPWIPVGSGIRIFRPLQEVVDGKLTMTPRTTASGKPIYEGGKKSGKQLYGPEPAEEVVFMFAWWSVMVNGEKKQKRLMLDPYAGGDINTSRFKNPLWDHIQENFAKNTMERKAIKLAFALNVWDMTPVMRNAEGTLFYPSESDIWNLLAYGNNGKLIDPKSKDAKLPEHYKTDMEDALEQEYAVPLNKIRILEGSYGKPGGKHLFEQFAVLANTVEDGDGIIRRLGEFDLRLATTGEGIDTNRAIRSLNRFQSLPNEANFGTRYDLKTWTQPWPNEAIQRLIDLEDYNTIVEEYKLAQFPTLFEVDETPVTPATKEEDGLFDE